MDSINPEPMAQGWSEVTLQKVITAFQRLAGRDNVKVIPLDQIAYIRASNNYSELHTTDGACFVHDKSLQNLQLILPASFKRIHRSYMCNWQLVQNLFNHGSGKYELELTTKQRLPISRTRYAALKQQ